MRSANCPPREKLARLQRYLADHDTLEGRRGPAARTGRPHDAALDVGCVKRTGRDHRSLETRDQWLRRSAVSGTHPSVRDHWLRLYRAHRGDYPVDGSTPGGRKALKAELSIKPCAASMSGEK